MMTVSFCRPRDMVKKWEGGRRFLWVIWAGAKNCKRGGRDECKWIRFKFIPPTALLSERKVS